jgi:hypothetical protein
MSLPLSRRDSGIVTQPGLNDKRMKWEDDMQNERVNPSTE